MSGQSQSTADIIVSPLHYSNAGFVAEVNHYLFDNAALVLNFEVEKEFRENVKTKYSNIVGLYYNLLAVLSWNHPENKLGILAADTIQYVH